MEQGAAERALGCSRGSLLPAPLPPDLDPGGSPSEERPRRSGCVKCQEGAAAAAAAAAAAGLRLSLAPTHDPPALLPACRLDCRRPHWLAKTSRPPMHPLRPFPAPYSSYNDTPTAPRSAAAAPTLPPRRAAGQPAQPGLSLGVRLVQRPYSVGQCGTVTAAVSSREGTRRVHRGAACVGRPVGSSAVQAARWLSAGEHVYLWKKHSRKKSSIPSPTQPRSISALRVRLPGMKP